MNKSIYYINIVACAVFALVIQSCSMHNMDHMNKTLNINYPAAYIVNGASSDISVLKLADNSITETIPLNGAKYPHHIYINPAHTKLAVAITGTDLSGGHAGHGGAVAGLKIQIIDAITGEIDKEIPLSKMPHNATYNKTGTELWVGQMDTIQSQVLVFRTIDWTLQHTIPVGRGVSEVTFSNDGTKAFACNTIEGTVSIINATLKTVEATVAVGQDPVGAWSASNGNMYVDNEKSKSISEIDVLNNTVTNTLYLGYKPGYAAYHKLSSQLWISDATNGKISYYTLVNNTWAIQGSIQTGADAHAIAFSSNGEKAYVTNQGAGNITVIDVATHSILKTITTGTKPNGIAIKD